MFCFTRIINSFDFSGVIEKNKGENRIVTNSVSKCILFSWFEKCQERREKHFYDLVLHQFKQILFPVQKYVMCVV